MLLNSENTQNLVSMGIQGYQSPTIDLMNQTVLDQLHYFSTCYCACEDYTASSVKSSQLVCNSLTQKDVEVIERLTENHSRERVKSRFMVMNKINCVSDAASVVFSSKPKGKKLPSDVLKNSRGSKYRGVSMNGKSWQVFIVINKVKSYAGCVTTETQAASLYDKLAIVFHG